MVMLRERNEQVSWRLPIGQLAWPQCKKCLLLILFPTPVLVSLLPATPLRPNIADLREHSLRRELQQSEGDGKRARLVQRAVGRGCI